LAAPPPKSRWVKGQSGNPTGRINDADVKALARTHTKVAMTALVTALKNAKTRVPAAIALLDRGWGKPTQPVEGLGLDKLVEVLERRRKRLGG
jgi:L-ascorbate metabolism protein UlaG (beta-lactamase superfamily)